jgi:hypothetical protein
MGQAVPDQHPAVVLRSQFNALRTLLAVALIAVIGLTVAVVVLASDEQQIAYTSPATAAASATRTDGGPEESAVAAGLGARPIPARPDESRIAEAIGSGDGASTATGGPDESVVAGAISGR